MFFLFVINLFAYVLFTNAGKNLDCYFFVIYLFIYFYLSVIYLYAKVQSYWRTRIVVNISLPIIVFICLFIFMYNLITSFNRQCIVQFVP